MKIDSSYLPIPGFGKPKSAREKSTAENGNGKGGADDSVQLLSGETTVNGSLLPGYAEALDAAGSLDFSKAVEAHSFSAEAAQALSGLM